MSYSLRSPELEAYQAPLSMEFSRQEYWSGLPFPSPADLPSPGTEPRSPASQADSSPSEPPGKALYFPSRLTCDAVGCSPPGSSVQGILQARILEWVAMPSSRGASSDPRTHPGLLGLQHWQAGSSPLAPPGQPSMYTDKCLFSSTEDWLVWQVN